MISIYKLFLSKMILTTCQILTGTCQAYYDTVDRWHTHADLHDCNTVQR